MRKFISACCFVACLALAAPAFAGDQTFGPDFSRFTITVPDGWKATPNDGGCQVISPDQKSSFSIQVAKNGGKSASELAKLIGQKLGGKLLSTEDLDATQTLLEAEVDGVKMKILVIVDGDKFCTVILAGPDEATMTKIMDSFKDAK